MEASRRSKDKGKRKVGVALVCLTGDPSGGYGPRGSVWLRSVSPLPLWILLRSFDPIYLSLQRVRQRETEENTYTKNNKPTNSICVILHFTFTVMRRMAWSNVGRWRWSPQITSFFPWTLRDILLPLLLVCMLTKTICPSHLARTCHWFAWQWRSRCTCHRCGAHLYSNKHLSLLPAARGGAGSVWLGFTVLLGESMQVCYGL